jgi:DNA-binding response OmpR family regulator
LIDDDPMVRDALAIGLIDSGFDVRVMPGAAAALDALAREPADAVVTDMNMPGFGGADLITALRERWPRLPIVAISGGGEINGQNVEALARERGADVCLVKPFRARDIAAALERLLAS